MPSIAAIGIAIRFKIAQKLQPVLPVIFIERSPWRSFNTEPDEIAIHDAPHPRERQTVITKCLPVTRSHHIDRARFRSDNFINNIAAIIFMNWWEAAQTLSPNILSFPQTRCFDCLPVVVNLEQLNSGAQRISQEHMT